MLTQLKALTHDSRPHLSWPARMIVKGRSWAAVRAEKGTLVTHHTKNITFVLDHVSVGLFSFSESFNVMFDYRDDGGLIRLYVNVASPASLADGVLSWKDYHLDVLVDPNGAASMVDVDEFEVAVEQGAYTREEASRFRSIADGLLAAASHNRFPLVRTNYDELISLVLRA